MPATRAARGPVESYMATLDAKERAALERVKRAVLAVAPDAVEAMSYGMPALKLDGKAIAGFAAFNEHLSYFPMSGTALDGMDAELAGFQTTKGTVQFTLERQLPLATIKKMVRARIKEMRGWKGR